jgi:putative DNA primase/helicase
LPISTLSLDQQMLAKYRVRGTLEEWQANIASLCTGNSRLVFAVSLAFTGPILRFVRGPRGGGFQLCGPKETGKTTAAMVAGSVWGCHREKGNREIGFAETWHTTANELEITALAHNDCLLILDEASQAGSNDRARAELVTTMVMTLAQLREKRRMTNIGSARSWRCYFLSTSNLTLDSMAQRGGVLLDDAQRSRLTEIRLPSGGYGIYENLHGFASGSKLTGILMVRCRRYYGVAGREFQRQLVADRKTDVNRLRRSLFDWRNRYVRALKSKAKAKGLKPLQRSTGRCATVYAAGRLAIQYGILPWNRKQLLQAVLACQLDGLRSAKAEHLATDTSVSGLRRKLITHLCEHRSKFMDLDDDKPRLGKHRLGSVPGYVATFKGKKWFYLKADQLAGIIGTGDNAVALKKVLVGENLMARAPNGRYVVQRPIFTGAKGNQGHKWVHAFRARILKSEVKD